MTHFGRSLTRKEIGPGHVWQTQIRQHGINASGSSARCWRGGIATLFVDLAIFGCDE